MDTNNSQVLQDIESLDYDISDEDMTASGSGETQTEDAGSVTETPGEAVLTGASTYMAQARIDREQVRSQNKEALNEIINNTNLSEAERQSAVQSLVEMTDLIEKETAAEQMLEAQGFSDVVVNLTGETADVCGAADTGQRRTAGTDRGYRYAQGGDRRGKYCNHTYE